MLTQHIAEILAQADTPDGALRPTELFNEGWMLRLLLDLHARNPGIQGPLGFSEGARWFVEALLASRFVARKRGDPLAESWTNADGVIGHFAIGETGKGDLSLSPAAKQFVVVEAKMLSGLSKGVKNDPDYDQAARNVACMAETLCRANIDPDDIDHLRFLILAPAEQIASGKFSKQMTKDSIAAKVERRVAAYEGEKNEWYNTWFQRTLEAVELGLVPWENLVEVAGDDYAAFYEKCIRYNGAR